MNKAVLPAALGLAGIMAALAGPAAADTRAGVDAWDRGEYRKAIDEWRPAAIAGEADAQFNLGQAYKLGRGVPVDLAMAESWYRKAALQGQPEGETNYGLILFQDGKRADALPWLEKSSARGEPRAQLVLGTMLYNGDGVPRDWPRAYALIVRAAASGSARASEVQAQMDQYVPADDRQRGLALARQYEADARRPTLPPELAGRSGGGIVRDVDVPPSPYARGNDRHPPEPIAAAAPPPAAAAPRRVAAARAAPAVRGRGWRLQFGAFRDEGNARTLWESLKSRVPALSGLQPFLVHVGPLTRLQAGPLATGAEGARVCAKVRPTGTPCVPVAP